MKRILFVFTPYKSEIYIRLISGPKKVRLFHPIIRIIQQFSVLQPPKFSYQTNAKLSIQREKKIGADVEFRAIILRWNPDRGQESHVSFVEEDSFVLQENKRGNEIVGTMILLTSSKILISLHPSNFSVFLPQLFSV